MNLQAEITEVVNRYIEHVTGAVRERARGMLLDGSWDTETEKASGRPKASRKAKPAKAKRGPRHCKQCGSVKHDMRFHTKKKAAPKKAVLHIAKAA